MSTEDEKNTPDTPKAPNEHMLTAEEAKDLSLKAAKAFQPRSPISTREFFAGRWEQLTTIIDAVSQQGLHVLIFGERGVGKTSLANVIDPLLDVFETDDQPNENPQRLVVKVNVNSSDTFSDAWVRAFDEISWVEHRPVLGFIPDQISETIKLREAMGIPDQLTIDHVRKVLSALKRSVFILDEFDRMPEKSRSTFTDLIKTLSDYSIDSTIVLVGVSETVDDLVADHASIVRAVVQIALPRMSEKELSEILKKASEVLSIGFDEHASKLIVTTSQGLPHYTHLIGLHAVRAASNDRRSLVTEADVRVAFQKAANQAVQSIRDRHLNAIHSARKDALYSQVVLACAAASSTSIDALGFFHPADVVYPLSKIMGRDNVTIATFQKHINEFCEADRGPILKREGAPRSYKYRFVDPLMPPYIFMQSVSDNIITPSLLSSITRPRNH